MRWSGTRMALLVGVVVLLELVGLELAYVTAVKAEPLPVKYGVWVTEGRESFQRTKRDQGKLVGIEIDHGREGVKNGDVSSSTAVTATGGDAVHKANVSKLGGSTAAPAPPEKEVKVKTLVIPDRTPANFSTSPAKEESLSEEDESDNVATKRPGPGQFDDKAIQRTVIVIAGIAVIVILYLGIKFALIKRRKVVKRYGRVEASEMDLLDEIEDYDESEEEELFDINQQRRS